MATAKKNGTLGQILKNKGFVELLERAKQLDDKEYSNLLSTHENNPNSEKNVSDLDELLFFTSDFYYTKNDQGEDTSLPAPGVFQFIDWALENGANPHTAMKYGISLFLKASSLKEESLVQYLIENFDGIDLHQKDGRGLDAIMYSVKNKSEKTFDYLLSLGEYDINSKYTFIFDKTLLHVACAVGDELMIDKLINLGADLTLTDTKGYLAKDYIPTQFANDLPDDEVTPEIVEKWENMALKLDELTENAIKEKNNKPKKVYKTSF